MAAGADEGVQPVGQPQRPPRASTAASAASSSRRWRLGPGQQQVVLEGADEDVVLLRDERDLAAQLGELEVDEAHAADVDPPGPRTVDAGHQPAERRLARPGRTDDGQPLPGHEVERDAVEHVATGPVGIPDVGDVEPVPSGARPLASRSGGTSAMPMTRASEVAPTWISSSHVMSSSSGPAIGWT